MEQKKVLWIIAAVGVFLLVVLGSALVLWSPKSKATVSQNVAPTNENRDSSGWIALSPNNSITDQYIEDSKEGSELPPPVKGDTPTFYDNTSEGYRGPLPPVNREPIDTQGARSSSVATINITTDGSITPITNDGGNVYYDAATSPSSSGERSSDYDYERELETDKTLAPSKPASNISKPTPKKPLPPPAPKPSAKKPAPKKSLSAAASSSAQAQVNIRINQKPKTPPKPSLYWVQVTALTSKKAADKARDTLFDNKIMADIFTYTDKSGKLFYRVRVGPYSTKSEAEYWKAKISTVEQFRGTQSYIAQTQG